MEKDDDFVVNPRPPRARSGPRMARSRSFVGQVMEAMGRYGPVRSPRGQRAGKPRSPKGTRRGRGQVVAAQLGLRLAPNNRRVIIKTRLIRLSPTSRAVQTHLRYIEREGVGRDGEAGHAYGPDSDQVDLAAFEKAGRNDRHQFRLIVSPEDAETLDDLRLFTRHLMIHMERDLGTDLKWVAVDHWNTDNPHTHIVIRGVDKYKEDLVIHRDYIAHGMRYRAGELATSWLGPRTELERLRADRQQIQQTRWTGLDKSLVAVAQSLEEPAFLVDLAPSTKATSEGQVVTLKALAQHPQRIELIGRLQKLGEMGLAAESEPGHWTLRADLEKTLRAIGERGDIIRTMQRALGQQRRELHIVNGQVESMVPIVGQVIGKGLADELSGQGYLIVDGIDGKAHYVQLPERKSLEEFPKGAIVEVRAGKTRAADQTIATLARDGIYKESAHRKLARSDPKHSDPDSFVDAHIRRLEALRRAGIVERIGQGLWHIPASLVQQGRLYDRNRQGSLSIELRSHLSVKQQQRALGATWLDTQLVSHAPRVGPIGFGAEVKTALEIRKEFLVDNNFAKKYDGQVIAPRDLITQLGQYEVDDLGRRLQAETGCQYRPARLGENVAGVYRATIQLVSGRFSILDDGVGFSLVPWCSEVEKYLGRQVFAIVKNTSQGISWKIGKGIDIGADS